MLDVLVEITLEKNGAMFPRSRTVVTEVVTILKIHFKSTLGDGGNPSKTIVFVVGRRPIKILPAS